jgi:iron complex outermembrane receptor protein
MSRLKLYRFRAAPIALGACLCVAATWSAAQAVTTANPVDSDTVLPSLSARGQQGLARQTGIGGFGNAPGWQQPMQTVQLSAGQLKDAQVKQLNDLGKLDASVGNTDAAPGYLEALSIRGFGLDALHNYRRDGLPIYAETRLTLDNVSAVEVLKGTSGMQAGMSAPGGLVNLVIKRPQGRVRQAEVAITPRGNLLSAVDLGDDLTLGGASHLDAPKVGLRLSLAHERLHPSYENGQGQRHLLALAGDTMLAPATKLEVELEHSRHAQAPQPALSMTGSVLPSAQDLSRDFNINSQPWSQPVRTSNTTGSVRLTQAWRDAWQGTVHYGEQHARTHDGYAYGAGSIGCAYQVAPCDRFGSDGSHIVVDYRSPGEQRLTRALDAHVDGKLPSGEWPSQVTAGLSRTLLTRRLPTATAGYAGFSNIHAPVDVPPSTDTTIAQNSANERSTEFYLRDHTQWSPQWHSWAGLRRTGMERNQYLSDGSQSSYLAQVFTTPWLAMGWSWASQTMAYASWGEGVEVPPVRLTTNTSSPIVNSGEALPAAKSRQWELGVQGDADWGQWGQRYSTDGDSRTQGLEGQWHGKWRAYNVDASMMWLDAQRRGSALAGVNGQAPVNVPDYAVRLSQRYRWDVARGLTGQFDLVQDCPRTADLVTGERLPAWLRCDASIRLAQSGDGIGVVWALSVRNAFDQRAWQASPNVLDHVYIQAMAAREWTASASINY